MNSRLQAPLIVEKGCDRTAVRLELREFGRDLILLVGGGESHAGAVAMSHHGGLGGEPNTDGLINPGHKEDILAQGAALALARATGRTCVVVAGIHQDEATREEIEEIVANVDRAVEDLLDRLA